MDSRPWEVSFCSADVFYIYISIIIYKSGHLLIELHYIPLLKNNIVDVIK